MSRNPVWAIMAAAALVGAGCGRITATPQETATMTPTVPAVAAAGTAAVAPPSAAPAAAKALPPVEVRHGNDVDVTLVAEPASVQIADGQAYQAWTFDGQVPGPVIRLRQGDTVHVTFINADPTMAHSLDLHAAAVAPSVDFPEVAPGKQTSFTFTADHPGVFLYHCGTPPMEEHIGNGMFGTVIVDPATARAPAQEYVLVQSEWYKGPVDLTGMDSGQSQHVVFDGVVDQFFAHPLPVDTSKLLRLDVVNAGPDLCSGFHVVGAVFDTVEPSGSPDAALHGLQEWTVAPGDAAMFELRLTQPGKYPFVTHAMDDMNQGALGAFQAAAGAQSEALLPGAAQPGA